MLEAKLVIVGGEAKAGEVRLDLPTTIGRGKEADLTIPHALVSRSHSKLFERDGQLWVEDLGSLNGTFVGNTRIESEQVIEPNQLLTLGNITFRAVYQVDQSARKTLPSTTLPDTLQTITIDPVQARRDDSESTFPVDVDNSEEVTTAARTPAELDTEPAPVFEEATPNRSAISEIDSFDPEEIGELDSMVEENVPQDSTPQELPPKVNLPETPASKPTAPVVPKRVLRASSPAKKTAEPQPAPPQEVAIDLGVADDAPLAPISSVDINLDLANDVVAAPVSTIGKIQTGDTDSSSLIDDFQIDLGSDDKPKADVDAVRLNSFLKKLPK